MEGVRWKLGQLRAGDTIRFKRISYTQAIDLKNAQERTITSIRAFCQSPSPTPLSSLPPTPTHIPALEDPDIDPRLHVVPPSPSGERPGVVFRQAGDSAILVEFGEMVLDLSVRVRVHAFESEVRRRGVHGVWTMAPCIRSTMVGFFRLSP